MNDTVLYYVFAAFVGGVILNVMPCVLPVLTMKVFNVLENADQTKQQTRMHGLAYTAGIMATFLVFALIIIVLRASGERMGWGMQFQNPFFVATMTALIYAFGLNALGVFEITVSVQGGGGGHGYGTSFVNGIVASIMSTPCSAPFLGSAATFALGSGAVWWQTVTMFMFIGLGLAFPFLIISFVPAVANRLPRPGAWMETFKILMGFTLMVAAVWLFGVLQRQVGPANATTFLWFLLALALGLWGMEHWGGLVHSAKRRVTVRLIALAVVAAVGISVVDLSKPPKPEAPPCDVATVCSDCKHNLMVGGVLRPAKAEPPVVVDNHINWAPFSVAKVKAESARSRPVFMDYTADWCLNCKTNEKAFIEVERIRQVLKDTNILPMKADMTEENEEIEDWLDKLGRAGIPAYVIYMPDGSHDLLPEAITTEMLATRLLNASKKYPPESFKAAGAAATKS